MNMPNYIGTNIIDLPNIPSNLAGDWVGYASC